MIFLYLYYTIFSPRNEGRFFLVSYRFASVIVKKLRSILKEKMKNNQTSSRFANRTLARTVVFQLLFQEDMNQDSPEEWNSEFLSEKLPAHEEIHKFALQLLTGVRENKPELDQRIEHVSKNWSLARMSVTDRNILRLALYEMMYVKTPKPVVINEAIELAKKFGSAESSAFVNGILDQF